MGTYCELYFADYPVISSKSQVSPLVMTLFRERDKKVFERKCIERNQIAWGHADWEATEVERVVEYTATVREVRDRLRIMGFTLPRAQAEFESTKAEQLEELRSHADGSGGEGMDALRKHWAEELALLERATFCDFLGAFREIVTSGVNPVSFCEKLPHASKLAKYALKDREEFYWGFPCLDIRSFFRALLEVVPEEAPVTQDLTDLVDGGYYEVDDLVCEKSLLELKGDYSVNSRIILLTEGPTDAEVLQASLELLFPHLTDYYSFMDLAVRAPGGAGSLVHVVKAFAGAGIENRTIALFDNDAAGHSAALLLRAVPLPRHIQVLNYPNITIASQYPTTGPNGAAIQDINGAACSIELYYGRDVLTNSGSLVPVQWRGFDEKVKRYQGEIQNKDALKAKFLKKVDAGKRSRLQSPSGDWGDMRQLLDSVFDAFSSTNGLSQ
jgi:hypothetical protein